MAIWRVCVGYRTPGYIIDIARNFDTRRGLGVWKGIEGLKGGYVYDKRYHFTDECFTNPHVWVFMNEPPKTEWLSADRWKIWMLNKEGVLIEWTAMRMANLVAWDMHRQAMIPKEPMAPDDLDIMPGAVEEVGDVPP